jgi:hypothetical protein
MTKKIILNDIEHVLEMIKDQVLMIQNHEAKIPQIEIDIIMSNVRRLYEDLNDLNRINREIKAEIEPEDSPVETPLKDSELFRIVSKEEEIVHEESHPEPVSKLMEVTAESDPDLPETLEDYIQQNEEEVAEPEKVKIHEEKKPAEPHAKTELPHTEPLTVQKEMKKESAPRVVTPANDLFAETESGILADKFKKDEKPTFYDKISHNNQDKTLADSLLKPLGDLRSGIGVNDRFLFINELFGGSMSDYQSAVEEINRQDNLNAGLSVLDQYSRVNHWKPDSEVFIKFASFVKRRFQ